MSFKKIIAMAAALTMTTAMFVSCGDTEESSSKADAGTTTTTTADANAENGGGSEEVGDSAAADDSAAAADSSEAAADSTAEGGDVNADPASDYTPVTEFEGYDAFLMFGDSEWLWGNWDGQGYPEREQAYGIDADVTGDGEYTVSITNASMSYEDEIGGYNPQVALDGDYALPATGCVVFCVDITGICDGTMNYKGEEISKNQLKDGDDAGVNKETKGKYTGQEITVEVTSIKADGQEVEFDPSKIVYGNIEDNNNCYRIEIYNDYGDTAKDPAIDKDALYFEDSLEVTFTISGLTQEG
ncbi:MAG: hypothetical protein Q4E74_07140 [Ruminococcus sp.]|nr:hypothetical protein [Ruminococcus sp.]